MATRPVPASAAAALVDELVEDILRRIPPDDPASLLRAALVCKRWCRIVSGAGFRRRFREFHRRPPMLGFLRNDGPASSFVSTSSFRLRTPPADRVDSHAIDARHGRVDSHAIDARHGRVLYQSRNRCDPDPLQGVFHVWDPITGDRRQLPVLMPRPVLPWCWNAAVLCATDGCQHLDCRRGPFMVIFVGSDTSVAGTSEMCAHIYSSEADAWSQQISAPHLTESINIGFVPSVLAENALYFSCIPSVLKYDLATQQLSLIQHPEPKEFSVGLGRQWHTLLRSTEDGGLGLASVCSHRLYLWSRKAGAGWVSKVIELTALLLPADNSLGSLGQLCLSGFAHGIDVIFVTTNVGIFTIDLKSKRVTKVREESWHDSCLPYMSFCTPALGAASAEGSRTGTSDA